MMRRILFCFVCLFSVTALGQPKQVLVEDLSIEFYDYGQGDFTLVVESGADMGANYWQPLIDKYKELNARVIVYSRAGNGSSTPSSLISLKQSSVRLNKLLKKLGVKDNIILLGHSFGALHTRYYASQFKESIAGIVLIDPSHERFQYELEVIDKEWAVKDNTRINTMLENQPEFQILQAIYKQRQIKDAQVTQILPTVIVTSSRLGESDWWIGHSQPGKKVWRELHAQLIEKNPKSIHMVTNQVGHNMPIEDVTIVIRAVNSLFQFIK